jgi:ABC-type antimicrobial peptide transport system, permease component
MISLAHCFKMSIASLKSSKLRSGLTALGIIIGIAAVVATFALGSSFTGYFSEELDTQGSNYVMFFATQKNVFTDTQADILRNAPGILGVSTQNDQTASVTYAGEQKNLVVAGVDEDMPEIMSVPLYKGNFFTNKDSYVAVVGKKYAEESFKKEIGIQSSIQITLYNEEIGDYVTETFRVIGILGSENTSLMMSDIENLIAIPSATFSEMTGRSDYSVMYAMADSREGLNETADELELRLARSLGVSERDLDTPEKVPFMMINQAELMEMVGTLTTTLQMFLMAIGGISLVVGAVGIMNIMIVTVTERTREIGTLKALGYSSRDVLLLFVIESIIISLIGGVIGTIIGLLIAYIAVTLIGFTMAIPISSIFFGIGLSVFVGVIAGAQPSYRAAKMNPVDALRDL